LFGTGGLHYAQDSLIRPAFRTANRLFAGCPGGAIRRRLRHGTHCSLGGVAAPGDVYGQTRRCLEIIAQAVADAGLSLSSVVRTRVMLTDTSRWQEAARARGVLLSHTARLHIGGG